MATRQSVDEQIGIEANPPGDSIDLKNMPNDKFHRDFTPATVSQESFVYPEGTVILIAASGDKLTAERANLLLDLAKTEILGIVFEE